MNFSATNRDVILICLVTSIFISTTLYGLTSFSRIKNLRKTCDASITFKDLGGISVHVMAENWQLLKDTLAFASFLVC